MAKKKNFKNKLYLVSTINDCFSGIGYQDLETAATPSSTSPHVNWFHIPNSLFTNCNLLSITNTTFNFQTSLILIKMRIVSLLPTNM